MYTGFGFNTVFYKEKKFFNKIKTKMNIINFIFALIHTPYFFKREEAHPAIKIASIRFTPPARGTAAPVSPADQPSGPDGFLRSE